MIVATPFAIHDTSRDPVAPGPFHRAVCKALLPWLSEEGALVLEGSVLRHQGRLRVFATIVDRQTHRVQHGFRYDSLADDAACEGFARALAESVEHRLGPTGLRQDNAAHAGTGSM